MFAKIENQKGENKLNTIIGPGCEIVGDIKTQGGLRIDGAVTGKIVASGSLTIGQEGVLKTPSIEVASATIGGKVNGDITAPEMVRLEPTARVKGNLITQVLIVEQGAVFTGNSDMSLKEESGQQHKRD